MNLRTYKLATEVNNSPQESIRSNSPRNELSAVYLFESVELHNTGCKIAESFERAECRKRDIQQSRVQIPSYVMSPVSFDNSKLSLNIKTYREHQNINKAKKNNPSSLLTIEKPKMNYSNKLKALSKDIFKYLRYNRHFNASALNKSDNLK